MDTKMLNKVPEVTLYFWIIKILCTTVGETAADYLNSNLGLGLTGTTLVMSVFLLVALFFLVAAIMTKQLYDWTARAAEAAAAHRKLRHP